MDILGEIRRVISLEAETLVRLHDDVDESFECAVNILLECKGKIVVTGIGKSGFIAQKIASTLISTGTQAVFLHAADALHGEIGIVGANDVVIALSKSGESDEVNVLIPVFQRLGNQIVAITSEEHSTLARNATVVLLTAIEKEACPLNAAPTCSSTAALVVGDALALCLMQLRGFGATEFALHHPGGQIGKRLLLSVKDIMRHGSANPVVPVSATVSDMLCEMTEKRAGAVSIVEEGGRLAGLVTDFDVRRLLESGTNVLTLRVVEIMNRTPITISPETKAQTALEFMEKREKPILVLPVVDDEKRAVGMVHLHDIVGLGL